MASLGELYRRARFYLNRNQRVQDLREELREHLEKKIRSNIAAGMSPDEARRAAALQFGNPAVLAERGREAWGYLTVESLIQDLRYCLRVLRRNPGFTAAAIGTLALGIGANTAIFSIVNAVLLKPLSYRTPDQLIALNGSNSFPDTIDIGEQSKTIAALGAYADWPLDLVGQGEPQRIEASLVGGDLFPALDTAPFLGNTFRESDDRALSPVVVASYDFWKAHLGSERAAIGRPLLLSGKLYTLIGVMPPEFRLPNGKSQLWIPFRVGYPEAVDARGAHFMFAVGRLRSGVGLGRAQAELADIGARLAQLHPEEARTFGASPLRERIVGSVRKPLLIIFGAAGLVLLIACSNFASLLMARAVTRRQEMNIRISIGAGRWRLLRQLFTESAVLSVVGGVVGILVARLSLELVLRMKPEEVASFRGITIDRTVLVFALLLSVITGTVFGMAPAFEFWNRVAMRATGNHVLSTRAVLRKVLVVSQLGLALVLLAGSGLLIRSFWRLNSVPLGFNSNDLLTLRFTMPASRYAAIDTQEQFLSRLETSLKEIPGVQSAALVTEIPLSGSRMMHNMVIRDEAPVPEGQEPEIYTHEISPDYFATLQMPVLAGRGFTTRDGPHAPSVGVINQSFARRFYPNANPIGREVHWARAKELPWITIVGVVPDIHSESLEEEQEPTIYTPFTQKVMPWKRMQVVVLRSKPGLTIDANAIRGKIWSLDSQLPITDVESLHGVVQESMKVRRFNLVLITLFAGLSIVLASMGIYGVIAYLVAQRTREIGVRIALGARRVSVLWLVLRQGLEMIAGGLVLGGIGAFLASRLLQSLLYDISATDMPTFAVVFCGLVAMGILATYIPARRAMAVDPTVALRYE